MYYFPVEVAHFNVSLVGIFNSADQPARTAIISQCTHRLTHSLRRAAARPPYRCLRKAADSGFAQIVLFRPPDGSTAYC